MTGRLRDLIIIRGFNYYPQDIELTSERCRPALHTYAGAAFSVEGDGEERLVLVREIRRQHDLDAADLFTQIRRAIAEEHGIEPYEIVLVRQGSVPKTSRGKIQRRACRELFLAGSLTVVAAWRNDSLTVTAAPPVETDSVEAVEAWLRSAPAAAFGEGFADYPREKEISWSGLDSLKAVTLIHRIEEGLGVSLSPSKIMQGVTLDALARDCFQALTAKTSGATNDDGRAPSNADESKPHSLSYGQRGFWFLHQVLAELTPDNIHIAARFGREVNIPALSRCFDKLARRHSALRITYMAERGSPLQRVRPNIELPFFESDATTWDAATLRQRLSLEAHHRFDLESELPFRIHLFQRAPEESVLMLVFHHSVADMWSPAIIARELGILYDAELNGETVLLPQLSKRYYDFVRAQTEFIDSPAGDEHRQYWQRQLDGELPALNLPTDRPRPPVQPFRGATLRNNVPLSLSPV